MIFWWEKTKIGTKLPVLFQELGQYDTVKFITFRRGSNRIDVNHLTDTCSTISTIRQRRNYSNSQIFNLTSSSPLPSQVTVATAVVLAVVIAVDAAAAESDEVALENLQRGLSADLLILVDISTS